MLSFRHEILVDLFRANCQLAPELLRACAGIAVDHARVVLESIDLTQVAPTAYYADAVTILRDRDDRPVTGVIVEVQLGTDEDKLLSWPVYVSTLRAKLRCAAVLLVLAPNPAVAAWARQPIELGHPDAGGDRVQRRAARSRPRRSITAAGARDALGDGTP